MFLIFSVESSLLSLWSFWIKSTCAMESWVSNNQLNKQTKSKQINSCKLSTHGLCDVKIVLGEKQAQPEEKCHNFICCTELCVFELHLVIFRELCILCWYERLASFDWPRTQKFIQLVTSHKPLRKSDLGQDDIILQSIQPCKVPKLFVLFVSV